MVEFVDSNATGADDGTSWTDAWPTLKEASDNAAAGEDIYVAADHSEATPGSVAYAFAGTDTAPNRVISANSTTSAYDRYDNLQIDLSGGAYDFTITGIVQFYGMSIKIGDDLKMTTNAIAALFDDCDIEFSSLHGLIQIGASKAPRLELANTDLNFSGGGTLAGFNILGGSVIVWNGGSVSWTGTQSTIFFNTNFGDGLVLVNASGVDFSAITSALHEIGNANLQAEMHHCLLNSGVSIVSGTEANMSTKILCAGCDDTIGNDLYRLDYYTHYGQISESDSIYRDDGASDGTNNISWKMASNGNAFEFSEPLVSPPILSEWIESTGNKTFTIHIARDSTESLQDDEIWIEIEYLGGSGSPTVTQSTFADNRMADPLGEGASPSGPQNQPASTEAWTGFDAGSPDFTRQRLDVTVSLDRVGPVIAKVHLAHPSATVYIDPLLEVA